MNINYVLYENYKTSQPFQTENGFVKRNNNEQYMKIADIESINNDKYAIVIDKSKRTILVAKPKQNPSEAPFPVELEKLLNSYVIVEFFNPNATTNAYRFKTKLSEYEQVEIYFNKKTYFIEKIILFSRYASNLQKKEAGQKAQKPRLEIICQNINTNPVYGPETFSEKKVLKVLDNTFEPTEKYTGYRILNTYTKNQK